MTALPDLLNEVALTHGSHTALRRDNSVWSYADLSQRSNRVAGILNCLVGPGRHVALILGNSMEYAASLFGIWKAGCVAVPINPQAGRREIEQTCRQCEVSAAFVEPPRLEASTRHTGILQIGVGADGLFLQDRTFHWTGSARGSANASRASDLAMLIHTSGTTSAPKAVELSHANLACNLQGIIDYLNLSADDRILAVLPFNYVYGNSVVLTALLAGAEVVIGASMMYPQQVVNQLSELEITGFSGVPATFAMLLERTNWKRTHFPALRFLTQAGGPMAHEKVKTLLANTNADAEFYVMYGQTEASARLTWLPPADIDRKAGSVGIPINDTAISVRDEHDCACPPGVVGEVCAHGPGVMAGYWKNPGATRKTLRGGWLHTGDIGYLDKDGYLYIRGRSSDIIKTGSHRVDPGEIEEVIRELAGPAEVAAVGIPDEVLGEKIRIVIEGSADESLTRTILRHCKASLPIYKMPREIVWMDALPRTNSGKIKRATLREMEC